MINFLSVDWDYFFPDFNEFNWLELNDPFFIYDMIWPIRYASKVISKNAIARDYYNPVWFYEYFWNYLIKTSPKMVFIYDDQESLIRVLSLASDINLFHFDQHDNGLDRLIKKHNLKLSNQKIITSKWDSKDFQIKGKLLADFRKKYPNFDIVFVCRNPKFTSSWNDKKWIKFINILKSKANNDCYIYEDKIAIQKRNFDRHFAYIWLHEQQVYLEKQRIRKMNGYIDCDQTRNNNGRIIRNHYLERKDRPTKY